jgi:hypothetical protein
MKDLPFTFFEFLAILLPGFLFVVFQMHYLQVDLAIPSSEVIGVSFLVGVAYITGQILNELSLWIFENLLVKKVIGTPVDFLLKKREAGWAQKLLFPRYSVPLDDNLIKKLKIKAGEAVWKNITPWIYETLWIEARSDDSLSSRLKDWSRLFSFSRTLAFTNLIVTFQMIFELILIDSSKPYAFLVLILSPFVGWIMFYKYLRFYRNFSQELCSWYALK